MKKTILIGLLLVLIPIAVAVPCNFQGTVPIEAESVTLHRENGEKLADADIYELGKYSVNVFETDLPIYFMIGNSETEQGLIEDCDPGSINWLDLTVEETECDHYVDETIELPQYTAVHQLDLDITDGGLTLLFCAWGIEHPNGSVEYHPAEFMSSQQCPAEPESINFVEQGAYTLTIMVAYVSYQNGVFAPIEFEDPFVQEYKVCHNEPTETQLQQLLEEVNNAICRLFGFCVHFSPETSLDCEWCDKECVEWKLLPFPPGLGGCDRTPPEGKVCVMDEVGDHKICAAKTPVEQGELITFCTEQELLNMIDYFNSSYEDLNQYMRVHCDNLTFPLDNCPTVYLNGSMFDMNDTFLGNNIECRSVCSNETQTVGGHILWDLRYNFDTGAFITPDPVSVVPYPTDDC